MSSQISMMKGYPRKETIKNSPRKGPIKDKDDLIQASIDERKADGSYLNVIRQSAKFKLNIQVSQLSLKGVGIPLDHLKTEPQNINQALGSFEIKKRRKAHERRLSQSSPLKTVKGKIVIPEKTKQHRL